MIHITGITLLASSDFRKRVTFYASRYPLWAKHAWCSVPLNSAVSQSWRVRLHNGAMFSPCVYKGGLNSGILARFIV